MQYDVTWHEAKFSAMRKDRLHKDRKCTTCLCPHKRGKEAMKIHWFGGMEILEVGQNENKDQDEAADFVHGCRTQPKTR